MAVRKVNKKQYQKRCKTVLGVILIGTVIISTVIFLALSLNGANGLVNQDAQSFLDSNSPSIISDQSLASINSSLVEEYLTAEMQELEEEKESWLTNYEEYNYDELNASGLPIGTELLLPKRGSGQVIYQGVTGRQKVALTFDSGWLYEPTELLLHALDDQNVKATFFMRGGWIDANPGLVEKVRTAGHEIGNHTYTHDHMPQLSDAEFREELSSTRAASTKIVGSTEGYYRPPYGEYNDQNVVTAGSLNYYYTVMWSVDSIDWMEPGQEEILNRVGYGLADGGIALMHVGVWDTAHILPEIIRVLRSRGLEPVPLSEIIDWSAMPHETYITVNEDTIELIAKEWGIVPSVIRQLNPFLD